MVELPSSTLPGLDSKRETEKLINSLNVNLVGSQKELERSKLAYDGLHQQTLVVGKDAHAYFGKKEGFLTRPCGWQKLNADEIRGWVAGMGWRLVSIGKPVEWAGDGCGYTAATVLLAKLPPVQ